MRLLTAPAGLPAGTLRRRPAVGTDVRVEETYVRMLGALMHVAACHVSPASRRIQYWMLNGMVREGDTGRPDPALTFDFTYMADRPIGWERPKTLGHVHSRPAPGVLGYAEVCEVLEGVAGFMIQDVLPGPRATFAALVIANAGERVILPPALQHATINLAGDPLVFSDIICRAAKPDYATIVAARGMAYFVDESGTARPNPAYLDAPPLVRLSAEEWSGAAPRRPLYADYVEGWPAFDWIKDPDAFPARFPQLWARIVEVVARLDAA